MVCSYQQDPDKENQEILGQAHEAGLTIHGFDHGFRER